MLNSNKISAHSPTNQNASHNRNRDNKSMNSSHQKNSAHSPTQLSNSNSKYKISTIQTNESRNSNHNNTKTRGSGKRFKTEQQSRQFINSSERNSKKQPSSTKRLKTDLTERIDSPKQQRFEDDHHNTASLAELLQFHTGYHDIDQQQFNYRVRKQTEGSKIENERKESSSRANSVVDVELGDNDKTEGEEDQQERNDEDEEKNIKQSKQSHQLTSNKDKSQKSRMTNKLEDDEDEDVPEIESDYTLGLAITNSKKEEPNFKKKQPKIRSYSHQDKLKIISDCKYVPKTESQHRMEARYLKGQLETIKELREAEEMGQFMTEYKNNKKKIVQQSAKKVETTRLMQNMKMMNKKSIAFEVQKKSVSLPKLKTYQEIRLPDPDQHVQQQKRNGKPKDTLSANRFHLIRKQSSMKNIGKKQHFYTEIENIQHIESVLRSKGVQFDVNVVRKGLMALQIPDFQVNKFEYPKNLISNPKYQKYPL